MSLQGARYCVNTDKKELVYFNLRSAAGSALRMGMALIRFGGDLSGGMEWFCKGARLAESLLGYSKLPIAASPWSGHHVLYCNLLVGDFQAAKAIARWIVSVQGGDPAVADTGDPFGIAAAHFALDDCAGFERARTAFIGADGSELHPYWRAMLVYIDLYDVVLRRDQAAFERLMDRREKFFVSRCREKAEGRSEYGGGRISPFVLDFMGIGIARVAIALGLSFNQYTEHVPKAVILAS